MKSGFVAILGRPNAGKSTLINALIKEKIAITSYKAETTRNTIIGILNENDLQIVFLDTPGIHEAKTILGSYMNRDALSQAEGADVIYYICDARNGLHAEDKRIIEQIEAKAPIFLLINKIDCISKDELIKRTIYAQNNYNFKEIIPISALKENNLDELLTTTKKYLSDQILYYPDNLKTASSLEFRIAEIIREKILLYCQKEIPHLSSVIVDEIKESNKKIKIQATIIVSKASHKAIVIEKQGNMLHTINAAARKEISLWLNKRVELSLFVKVEEDWINKKNKLYDLGYLINKNER